MRTRLTAVVLILISAVSCGVRTAPRPPEDTIIRIGTIQTERSATGEVEIRWKRPRRSADGTALHDLAGFTVERSGADEEYRDVATIVVDDNVRVRPRQSFRYTDENAPAEPLSYRVRAFDSYQQQGVPSPAARVEASKSE